MPRVPPHPGRNVAVVLAANHAEEASKLTDTASQHVQEAEELKESTTTATTEADEKVGAAAADVDTAAKESEDAESLDKLVRPTEPPRGPV